MVRPKSGTPEGERAKARWHRSMLEKYGENYTERFKEMGRKGGKATHRNKGFAANRKLASEAGRKGGLISRRTGIKNGEGKKWWRND